MYKKDISLKEVNAVYANYGSYGHTYEERNGTALILKGLYGFTGNTDMETGNPVVIKYYMATTDKQTNKTIVYNTNIDGREIKSQKHGGYKISGNAIFLLEPVRLKDPYTKRERLRIYIHEKEEEMEMDGDRDAPYIDTDIINIIKDIQKINLYGCGLLFKDIKELEALIRQNYRHFPVKQDKAGKSFDMEGWVGLEAKQLYEACVDKFNQTDKKDRDSAEGPDKEKGQFNILIKHYKTAVEDHFKDSLFKEREVRQKLKEHGYIACNTPECSNAKSNKEGKTRKYMTFNVHTLEKGKGQDG